MICVIKECPSDAVKTGLCSSHYKKRMKGDYSIEKRKFVNGSFKEVVKEYTKRLDNGCLEWTGPINKKTGYGRFHINGKRHGAHRVIYSEINGIKNDKNHIHHKCGNKLCVEISHLEELSHFFHLKSHKRDKKGRLLPSCKLINVTGGVV